MTDSELYHHLDCFALVHGPVVKGIKQRWASDLLEILLGRPGVGLSLADDRVRDDLSSAEPVMVLEE